MKDRECSRCNRKLSAGSLAYVFHVRVFADFDGVLVESEGEIDQRLEDLLHQVEQQDPEDLEKEVYEEFVVLLCKGCRDRFVKELCHPRQGPCPGPPGPGPFLH